MPKGNIDIRGEEQGVISLTLTVPFACPIGLDDCLLSVQMYIPKRTESCTISTLKRVKKDAKVCGVWFTNKDVGHHKNITLRTIAGDNFNAKDVNPEYAVFLQIVQYSHPFMHTNLLEPVRVCLLQYKPFLFV